MKLSTVNKWRESEPMDTDTAKHIAKQSAKQRLENRFLEAFAAVKPDGVPMPEREHRFHPERKWRFDFVWAQIKLAVEIHGGGFVAGRHNRGANVSDFEKMNEAQRLGWIVLAFGTKQLDHPGECAAYVVDVMADIGQRKAS